MLRYWDQCVDTFRALSYVVKRADPQGIQLCFTSSPGRWTRYKHTTPAANAIKKRRDRVSKPEVPCFFEDSTSSVKLHRLVQSIVERKSGSNLSARKRMPMDIFIFTDGKWNQSFPEWPNLAEGHRSVATEPPECMWRLHLVRFGVSAIRQESTTTNSLQTLHGNQLQDGSQANTQ